MTSSTELWKGVDDIFPHFQNCAVTDFLVGDKEYLSKKCAINKIMKWYKRYPIVNDSEELDDIYTRSYLIRIIIFNYEKINIQTYPSFAIGKMAMYSPKVLEPFDHETSTVTKSMVLKWMLRNLDEYDLALIGY